MSPLPQQRQFSRVDAVLCVLWCAIGLALFLLPLPYELPEDWRSLAGMAVVSSVFLYAGIGFAFRLPAARILAGLLSGLVILNAALLVLMGTEDVGGPGVSVPSAIALLTFAGVNIHQLVRLGALPEEDHAGPA